MATHSSILAWRIPWTEEPGRLQSMRLQRVGHSLAIKQQRFCKSSAQVGGKHPAVTSRWQPKRPFLPTLSYALPLSASPALTPSRL